MPFNWNCPFCDRAQTVTDERSANITEPFKIDAGAEGHLGIRASAIVCANAECRKTTVMVSAVEYGRHPQGQYYRGRDHKTLASRKLMPEGSAKPLPDYVPRAIRDDYREACLIRDLSPKASATLSRRCLQGMIRDFAGIKVKGNRLYDEIAALKTAVDEGTAPRDVSEDSIGAIDAARTIGNIGAHMEAEINLIVDVEPEEAAVLIELIESLIDDWYVNRFRRQERFAKTVAVAAEKKAVASKPLTAATPVGGENA